MTQHTIPIIDSHCHIHFENFAFDIDQIIARANNNFVKYMITVGTEITSHENILKLTQNYHNLFGTIGIHPCSAEKTLINHNETFIYEYLLEHGYHSKIVGIGETGLDFYVSSSNSLVYQEKSLIAHIEAAKKLSLPLIIHTRNAEKDTIRILKQNHAHSGVFHCFTGSQDLAYQALEIGFYISFSGIATFKNSTEIRNIIKNTPLDKILIETDSPYLSPEPLRKIKRNEPSYIVHILNVISEIHKVSNEIAGKIIFDNTIKLFDKISKFI